jgi:hypothetical protein
MDKLIIVIKGTLSYKIDNTSILMNKSLTKSRLINKNQKSDEYCKLFFLIFNSSFILKFIFFFIKN